MSISNRKNQHIKLVKKAQISKDNIDCRFNYEPMLSSHIIKNNGYKFIGKDIGGPIFISSMTGGSKKSIKINRRIACAAKEFNLPMGLGSLRPYIEGKNIESFNIRKFTGDKVLLFGNLGISQIETLLHKNEIFKINNAIRELDLNGLIIHINPLQEWVQIEGDRLSKTPITILKKVLPLLKTKIIIKEVGAGFGKESLNQLLKLQFDALDLSSFGGTNFTKLELLRTNKKYYKFNSPLINIGHSSEEMIVNLNNYFKQGLGLDKEFIISGGIQNFLDGYYYNSILNANSIYGYANNILKYALKSERLLHDFFRYELENYSFSQNFLKIKSNTFNKN